MLNLWQVPPSWYRFVTAYKWILTHQRAVVSIWRLSTPFCVVAWPNVYKLAANEGKCAEVSGWLAWGVLCYTCTNESNGRQLSQFPPWILTNPCDLQASISVLVDCKICTSFAPFLQLTPCIVQTFVGCLCMCVQSGEQLLVEFEDIFVSEQGNLHGSWQPIIYTGISIPFAMLDTKADKKCNGVDNDTCTNVNDQLLPKTG